MKFLYLMMLLFVNQLILKGQNIGIGTNTPSASAVLELKASDKGLLIPRTSTASRTGIVNPAKGLLMYDSTTGSFWYHSGLAWLQFENSGKNWSTSGNAGTNIATNFFGTSDAQALIFKINNTMAGILDFDPAKANTAFGFATLQNNTNGYNNTATGFKALMSNTTGTSNTANGMFSLYLNQSGNQNTANGFAALYSNIDGNYNTATGAGALNVNTGSWNTANGAYAMYLNSTGGYNTALGYEALYSGSTGSENTAIGHTALREGTTGASNTAMGQAALGLTNTGSSNTGIGQHALFSNKSGNSNTALGFFADVAGDNLVNATAIGANAVVTASNSIQLGDNDISSVKTAGNMYVKNGKGIVRSDNGAQKLIQTVTVTVNGNINAYSVLKVPIVIPEIVGNPVLYVGNMLPDGVGAPGISMYITSSKSPFLGLPDSHSLNVYHISPSLASSDFNFQVKIVIIGDKQ